MLIVLDGIDGAGKTTQTKLLFERLRKESYSAATLDFPQYTKNFFGKMVQQFLHGEFGNSKQVDPRLAALLYAFDRWESKRQLEEWQNAKKIIILNRYVTANLIHQTIKLPSHKRPAFIRWVEKMEYHVLGLPKPDIVLYLHLPYQLACALIEKRGNKKDIHEEDKEHLKKAAAQGLKLTKTHKNWHRIPCSKGGKILSRDKIEKQIWGVVSARI